MNKQQVASSSRNQEPISGKKSGKHSLLPKSQSTGTVFESNLTSAEAQQVRTQPLDIEEALLSSSADFLQEDQNSTLIEFIKQRKKHFSVEESTTQKQQILEELHVRILSFYFIWIHIQTNWESPSSGCSVFHQYCFP